MRVLPARDYGPPPRRVGHHSDSRSPSVCPFSRYREKPVLSLSKGLG
jgi:hypothetical protein